MDNLNQLRTLLEQIRSTTKPVDEEQTEPMPEWETAFSLIAELLAEKPSEGTAMIAEALKAILDKDFPKAQLTEVPPNGAGRLVVFCDKGNYFTVEIRE